MQKNKDFFMKNVYKPENFDYSSGEDEDLVDDTHVGYDDNHLPLAFSGLKPLSARPNILHAWIKYSQLSRKHCGVHAKAFG